VGKTVAARAALARGQHTVMYIPDQSTIGIRGSHHAVVSALDGRPARQSTHGLPESVVSGHAIVTKQQVLCNLCNPLMAVIRQIDSHSTRAPSDTSAKARGDDPSVGQQLRHAQVRPGDCNEDERMNPTGLTQFSYVNRLLQWNPSLNISQPPLNHLGHDRDHDTRANTVLNNEGCGTVLPCLPPMLPSPFATRLPW
jgi:hypothetical protein